MPRDLRRMLRGSGGPSPDISGRTIARSVSKLLFIAVLAGLLIIATATDHIVVALGLMAILSQFFRIVLPVETIREKGEWLWTGKAGEEAYEEAADVGSDGSDSGWFR